MAEVLIISGAGDYSDPWHRFGDTSLRLAEIIAGLGHQVTISDAVEQALADPGESDLIVVNIGNPASLDPVVHRCRGAGTRSPSSARWRASRTACQRHIDDHHVAMVQMLGGHWVKGRTMHPKQDLFTVVVHDGAHPIVEGLSDFTVFDERYCYLHTNPDITVMCSRSPTVGFTRSSGARVRAWPSGLRGPGSRDPVVQSTGHVNLLRRTVGWLLGDDEVAPPDP